MDYGSCIKMPHITLTGTYAPNLEARFESLCLAGSILIILLDVVLYYMNAVLVSSLVSLYMPMG